MTFRIDNLKLFHTFLFGMNLHGICRILFYELTLTAFFETYVITVAQGLLTNVHTL